MLAARAIAFDRSLDLYIEVLNLLSKLHRYSLLHRLDVALSDRRWLGDERIAFVLFLDDCQLIEVGLRGFQWPKCSRIAIYEGCSVR